MRTLKNILYFLVARFCPRLKSCNRLKISNTAGVSKSEGNSPAGMDQRRSHSKPQAHYNRRRHYNSNLNPSANDFIPTSQYYERPAGPSHSRDEQDNQSEPWPRDERRFNQEYGDARRNNPRRNQYGNNNNNRPRFSKRPQNYNDNVNPIPDSESRNNYSNGQGFYNRRNDEQFDDRDQHYNEAQQEPPFDYNGRESREMSDFQSNCIREHQNHKSSSARNNNRRYGSPQSSRHYQGGSSDVRFDDFYQDQVPNNERQDRFRPGSSNQNLPRRSQFGKPNNSRDKRYNNDRNYNNGRDSQYQQSPFNSRERSFGKNGQNVHVMGHIGIIQPLLGKINLDDKNSNYSKFNLDEEVTSQRDKLIQILFKGTQECLVCCEKIAQAQAVWSCGKCYNILHLVCTIQWADSSHTEQGWRCPACQNVSTEVPKVYECFCKKQVLDIGWNRSDIPHSCGEVCSKELKRGDSPCGHRCTLLCHPGPCPVCEIVITRYCGCKRTNCQMQCGSTKVMTCSAVCGKLLNCQQHQCEATCHEGTCQPCSQLVEQKCFCGANTKSIICSADVELNYSCEGTCSKQLECGNHECSNICHPGPCDLCYLMPQFITTCCCGKTHLSANQKRNSCTDPIPTCTQVCGKTLHCGELEEKHKCKAQCHEGDCPVCKLSSVVLCNCRQRKRQIQCSELKPGAVVKCNIKCSTMRSCGKHKCNQVCCISQDHICPLTCNKKLRCGTHKCELLCHKGPCPPCMNVSFEELTCRCGGEVIFPPVPCGTKPPLCGRVCSRSHPCSHPPAHTCHDEPECPPCVVFTEKWCFGKHQVRKNIFCYVNSYSCGQACGKVLKCQRHYCILPCHEGDCLKANEKCKQVCTRPRPACGHPCNEKCHPGACPGSTCTMKIQVACSCGERSETQACIEDKSLLEQFNKTSKGEYKILECNETCAQIDRNRRLALGLQIKNPDLNLKLKPVYPDFLKQWAKKDPEFCNYVHSRLSDLVKLSKDSKQKSRSFSFEVMNRDKRQFIHGYCEFFGISAIDCDPEPKRNVLVTAYKDKVWLPGYSLMETIQREKGQPKVPMLPSRENLPKSSRSEMVQLGGKKS